MPRKKKEPKPKPEITVTIDPEWEAWLHNTEAGQRTWLEASAMLYQFAAQNKADELPDGPEKQEALRMVDMFKHIRPSVHEAEAREWERLRLQWEAEDKQREAERQFLIKELNRMKSLPEPIFILELPDEVIQKLIAKDFDSVGKTLFGVQVATQRIYALSIEDGWETALLHSRDLLIDAVGQEGYNFLGSRLIKYGYLQRNLFLSELRNENEYKPDKGK